MKTFEYTVETHKSPEDAVRAVEQESANKGFRVLHVHDVAATLQEKGFAREPLKIVEICNARYASEVLKKDIRTALMLPCPIAIYAERGKTFISTLLPTSLADFFPQAGIEGVAARVEAAVRAIVDEAK